MAGLFDIGGKFKPRNVAGVEQRPKGLAPTQVSICRLDGCARFEASIPLRGCMFGQFAPEQRMR